MALTTKRIIALPSQTDPQEGDYLAIDNATNGTHKIPVGRIGVEVDDTLTEQGKAADAKAVGDALDEIRSQIEVTGTDSGAIATFADGSDTPMKSCIVTIEPKQSGTGTPSPSNVRPISGWESVSVTDVGKNLFGGEAFANGIKTAIPQAVLDTEAKTISYLSGYATEGSNFTNGIPFKENTQYTIMLRFSNTKARTNVSVVYTDGTNQYIPTSVTGLQTAVFTTAANKTIDYIGGKNSDGASVFYYEECGVFEGVLTADQFEPYTGTTTPVNLGRTVYGGTLDVVSGALTVDKGFVTFDGSSDEYWGREAYQSGTKFVTGLEDIKADSNKAKPLTTNLFVFRAWAVADYGQITNIYWNTSNLEMTVSQAMTVEEWRQFLQNTPLEIVYYLATPQTYTLTPTEVKTLLGENNVWADSGDVEVVYIRDLNIAINNLLNSNGTRSLGMMAMSAPTEATADEQSDEQSDEDMR